MTTNKWFLFIVVIFIVLQQIQSACVCNEKGTDECAACSEIRIVRPKPKYGKKPEIELPPIGDNCWCSKTMIEPASLPKPCPKYKKPTPCTCPPEAKPYSLPSIFTGPSSYTMPKVNYINSLPKDDSLPADPISVSLAIQAGKAIEVPEAKLAYGFVQKPIDGLPRIFISNIQEEKLYALKNEVITLKKPYAAKAPPPEDDYPEPEDEEPAPEEEEAPVLTYKQLGYVPEQFKNPQFKAVPSAYAPAVVEGKFQVDCGFVPGRITKYNPPPPKKYAYAVDC
ncbi:chorion protein a at 7F [Cochliomyia hominivorax]